MSLDNQRKTRERRVTLLVKGIPVDTRNAFKAYCARRGINMSLSIVRHMKRCIREENALEIQRIKAFEKKFQDKKSV